MTFQYPNKEQTEQQKRWLSWTILSTAGVKHTYRGTANPNKVAKRRAKNKVAKASRKANR